MFKLKAWCKLLEQHVNGNDMSILKMCCIIKLDML